MAAGREATLHIRGRCTVVAEEKAVVAAGDAEHITGRWRRDTAGRALTHFEQTRVREPPARMRHAADAYDLLSGVDPLADRCVGIVAVLQSQRRLDRRDRPVARLRLAALQCCRIQLGDQRGAGLRGITQRQCAAAVGQRFQQSAIATRQLAGGGNQRVPAGWQPNPQIEVARLAAQQIEVPGRRLGVTLRGLGQGALDLGRHIHRRPQPKIHCLPAVFDPRAHRHIAAARMVRIHHGGCHVQQAVVEQATRGRLDAVALEHLDQIEGKGQRMALSVNVADRSRTARRGETGLDLTGARRQSQRSAVGRHIDLREERAGTAQHQVLLRQTAVETVARQLVDVGRALIMGTVQQQAVAAIDGLAQLLGLGHRQLLRATTQPIGVVATAPQLAHELRAAGDHLAIDGALTEELLQEALATQLTSTCRGRIPGVAVCRRIDLTGRAADQHQ